METLLQTNDLPDTDPGRLDLKALRNELRNAHLKNSLPRQRELAELSIDLCIEILTTWKDRCTCDMQYVTEQERQKSFRKRGGAKLCQSCKRVAWALRLWIDIERILIDRLKIDAGIIKLPVEDV